MARRRARPKERGFSLALDPEAIEFLIRWGLGEDYGARLLRRVIGRYVEDPLAERLLRVDTKEGPSIEVTTAPDGELLSFTPRCRRPRRR